MPDANLVAGVIAFLFTVMILSYLIGDNPLFRIAIYIFVGVSAGYVAVVAWWQVLWPNLLLPLVRGSSTQRVVLVVPLLLGTMLLMKSWPSLTRLGMPAMGLLVGVGAAVAMAGAVSGTLLPQINATIGAFDASKFTSIESFVDAFIILAALVATLVYFHFGARTNPDGSVSRFRLIELAAYAGSIFVAITLGVLFAGIYSAALTAFIERLHFLGTFFGLG
ncbi:MAG TPA: hypothetical protein VF784_12905 [Anaerolineales bacterium]